MNSATDLTLLHRIQQADAPAMAELYRRHSAVVYSIALRVATATALAEQVLADVFLQIWRTPDRFLPLAANLSAALIFIARNRAVALTRDQPSPADFQLPAWLAILQPNASTREQALAALAQIPADRREILERAFFLDPPPQS